MNLEQLKPEAFVCIACGWEPPGTQPGNGGGTSVLPVTDRLLLLIDHQNNHALAPATEEKP